MGASKSKEEKELEEELDRVYEPYLIQWDDNGHLRYGESHKVDPGRQMVEIMELDYVDDTDGKKWYLVDTAWLAAWLAYVHLDKFNAPAPGPCRNNRLIEWDALENKWIGRHGLMMSTKNSAGDFRRVSRETWQKFKEFYPNSGPSITMEFKAIMNNGEETYIGKHFNILDPPPPVVAAVSKSKKKKAQAAAAAAAAAEAAAAAKKADAANAAAQAKSTTTTGPLPMEDNKSEIDTKSERSRSVSSVASGVPLVPPPSITLNNPKVVSNMPRNPVLDQFTQRAVEQAQDDVSRASERSSVSSVRGPGAPYGSFSGVPPSQAAATTASIPPRKAASVQDMYYAKD